MDTKKKKQGMEKVNHATSHPEKTLYNEKATFPGQQIGLYGGAGKNDVKQMVKTLNSPGEDGQRMNRPYTWGIGKILRECLGVNAEILQ